MKRWALTLILGSWVTVAQAQTAVIPVIEVGANLYQNTVTAIYQVLSVANEMLELTPVDEVIVGGQIAEDLAALAEIVSHAELVWYDIKSLDTQITALFGLDTAPDTREGLDERLLDIKQFYYRTLSFAMRTQTLMMTALNTVEHITRLVDSISSFVGNMQGNQVMTQTNATISKTLTIMEAQQAAWQRSDTVQRLSEGVVMASLEKIALKRLEDHPRY
jgi:hypothetical protein